MSLVEPTSPQPGWVASYGTSTHGRSLSHGLVAVVAEDCGPAGSDAGRRPPPGETLMIGSSCTPRPS